MNAASTVDGNRRELEPAYLEGLERWRRQKEEDLRRRDSWLALAGLHWLANGETTVGSDAACDIRLPAGSPGNLGVLEVRAARAYFLPTSPSAVEGAPLPGRPLLPDTAEGTTFLRCGELTMIVIERGDRLGLRVWDNSRLSATGFAGRQWYPPHADFVIRAPFTPAVGDATIPVPSVTGDVAEESLLGTASFTVGGRRASLHAVPTEGDRLWFLFGDLTNETTTYRSGRFLTADAPQDGIVILDFNRAYNPPCAFTPYATCPLPPPDNRLAIPIEAGEMYPHEHRL